MVNMQKILLPPRFMSSSVWDKKFFMHLFFIYFVEGDCQDDVFEVSRAQHLGEIGMASFHVPSLTDLVSLTFKAFLLTDHCLFIDALCFLLEPRLMHLSNMFQFQGLSFGQSLNLGICNICFLKLFRSLINVISSQMSSRPHHQTENSSTSVIPFFPSCFIFPHCIYDYLRF